MNDITIDEAIWLADTWVTNVSDEIKRSEVLRAACKLLADEVIRLRDDEKRINWMADKNNTICQVLLPEKCVYDHLDSMRAAIDQAMELTLENLERGI